MKQHIKNWRYFILPVATCVAFLAFTAGASAGTVILEGSDAIEFHCTENGVAGACTYEAQVWKALTGASALPIAVIEGNTPVALSAEGSGATIDNFATVAAAGGLSAYAAVYLEGDDGDNGGPEGDTAVMASGATALLQAYLAGGGTVMIENYQGGGAFDGIVGTSGGANADVAGYGGGAGGGVCDDGETVTATGLANGFTQPPAISCWEHQGYNESYFTTLGFTKSFFDAGPSMGGAGWSGLLSSGETITGSETPEPSTLILFGGGALMLVLGGAAFGKRVVV